MEYGLGWDYGGMSSFVCFFWTALAFIDPLAVVLLVVRPMLGLALTVGIIVSDVAINSWVGFTQMFDLPSFSEQVLFLVFVMSTVRIAWRSELGCNLRQQPSA